ncbi:molybdopterin-dependent oxidoreductase [Aestuariibacter sp. AA17]|uniref:Molybdopterin-dependent oxidoreductase n=1 Tax=Fluctibacter corallii TaxID=2984329 RepID=A0ABT3A7E7_9ALTE|nr:molybdopterin cofactor-binding domain-containing protein [Aestuariibacter sp. AA17]MCV2884507.1 molybdopterin-dependent oxidoreductase [Aestuariibacter sp. AA17]
MNLFHRHRQNATNKQQTDDSQVVDHSRRDLLIGTVNATLMIAFAPTALSQQAPADVVLASKSFSPTIWYEIDETGTIKVNIIRAEMGQHVGTALAKIVAEELGANWQDVIIDHVDTDPKWGMMVTGGSWSVFQSYQPLSRAGAAGRELLLEAGAKHLGVSKGDCIAKDSQIVCGNNRVSFATLIKEHAFNKQISADALKEYPIKSRQHYAIIGKQSQALDIPPKVNGTAVYGIDVEIPNMLYARPVVPPTRFGNKVKHVDDTDAKAIKGYKGYKILTDPSGWLEGWVAVYATHYPAAIKAVDSIRVTYHPNPKADVSEADMQEHGHALISQPENGALLVDVGSTHEAQSKHSKHIEATYTTSTALHFQLEPVNAIAEFKDGTWHLHSGNQWQSLTLPEVAKALEVDQANVVIHQYYLGGGFGRRLFGDYIIPAALAAKAMNQPVKMIFTREDDAYFDQPRSPSVSYFKGTIDANSSVAAVEHRFTAGWPTKAMAPGFLADSKDGKKKIDMFSASGSDHWYSLPNNKVLVYNNDLAQQTFVPGWLRSVGPGWIMWSVESFMDELAHATKQDPAAFRRQLLTAEGRQSGSEPHAVGGAARLRNVLDILTKKVDTQQSLPKNEGIGIALTFGQERSMPTWVALAAHVSVSPTSGKVTVKKLTCVVDCGIVVHPDGAMAQMEGSLLWGVSLALHESTEYKHGQVASNNLHNYSPLRMKDVPDMDISFVDSDEFPVGLGEPGTTVVAPAIGNAIFNATGVRLRALPMTPKQVKMAMNSASSDTDKGVTA